MSSGINRPDDFVQDYIKARNGTYDYTKVSPDGEILLNERGHEIPDDTPVAPPVGYKRQPSLAEQIHAMVRSAKLAQEAEDAGMETFEEADDFDVGEDYDPSTPYEEQFEPVSTLKKRAEEEEAAASTPPKPKKQPSSTVQVESGIGSDSDDREAPEEPRKPAK